MSADLETILGAEAFAASVAVIRTVAGVFAHVCHQTVSGVERPRTLRACMRPAPGVLHHMFL